MSGDGLVMSLAELDATPIDAAQALPIAVRDGLLSAILGDGRRLFGPQIERQAGLFCDYFEEDLTRLLKVRAVRLTTSGIIPVDERGEVPSEEPEAQFRKAFDNLGRAVGIMGARLARVTNLVIFLRDMSHWSRMNTVYRDYFPEPPTRAVVGTSGLNRGYLIELVNIVAYKVV